MFDEETELLGWSIESEAYEYPDDSDLEDAEGEDFADDDDLPQTSDTTTADSVSPKVDSGSDIPHRPACPLKQDSSPSRDDASPKREPSEPQSEEFVTISTPHGSLGSASLSDLSPKSPSKGSGDHEEKTSPRPEPGDVVCFRSY